MKYFLKQMSAILAFKNKIRPLVVPGRDSTLVYIQRALLYGPLATLINPSEIPDGTEMKSAVKSVQEMLATLQAMGLYFRQMVVLHFL